MSDLVFPENIHDDKNLCGREEELGGIFKQFWSDLEMEEEIPQFCLQVEQTHLFNYMWLLEYCLVLGS